MKKLFLTCLILVSAIATMSAQVICEVSGTILDPSGEPAIGANIVEKGTTNGVISDIDGNFSLTMHVPGDLVISMIGYKTIEVHITKCGQIVNNTFEDESEILDEVVVIPLLNEKEEPKK